MRGTPDASTRTTLTMALNLHTTPTKLIAALVVLVFSMHSAVAAAPSAPTGLTVTGPVETQLTLSWTASSGATSYNVYRSTTSGSETLVQSGVGGTTFEDNGQGGQGSGLSFGQTYYYKVTAVNSSNQESTKSSEASAMTKAAPPANITATAGDSQVVVTWTASPSATSYRVYRDTLGGPGGATSFPVSGGSTTSYTDSGLVNGTPYYYQVSVINPSGEDYGAVSSGAATPVAGNNSEAPVGAPANPTAVAGNSQVLLKWLPVSNATTYDIYRRTTGSETLYHSGVTALTFADTGLTNGTAYYYEVRGDNGATRVGSLSTEVSATPIAPVAPTGLTATAASGQVVLNWTAAGTSYAIYRGIASGAETLLDSGLTGSTFTDCGVNNGITYYYKVQVLNANGTGPLSSEVSAAPTGPAAQPWTGTVNFSLPGEPVQTGTATIADLHRPVLFAFFHPEGPNMQAVAVKYNALTFTMDGWDPYNFGTLSNIINWATSDDSSHLMNVLDFRWPQQSATRLQAFLTAAAAAVSQAGTAHPEIVNTGIVLDGLSEGVDNANITVVQPSLINRVLAVVNMSEIDQDRWVPIATMDTAPHIYIASGLSDGNSSLNLDLTGPVTYDAYTRGLATNQGAPLTVLDEVGQGHLGVTDHPFISIWLDSILSQRLPATLPVSGPVNLPSWQNSSAWAGSYNVTTNSNAPWGSSGNPGVQMVSNIISSRYAYTDPRPFTWLPSQNIANTWLAYANSGNYSALAPVITSPTAVSGAPGSTFAYQIVATNLTTGYNATGPNGAALPSWLTLNPTTGILSGTLPQTAGTTSVTLSGTNVNGTGTATLVITVTSAQPPVITSPTTQSGAPGSIFSYQITASNSPASYNATGPGGSALPAWLSVNTSTGVLSGLLPLITGTTDVTVSATNGKGTGSATLAITVNPVVPLVSFSTWAASFGLTNSTTLTTEGDGVPILLKYLCGINPILPMTDSERATLPTQGVNTTADPGTIYLTLTYTQAASVTGVSTHVQTSPDLKNWTTVTPDLSEETILANGNLSILDGIKLTDAGNQFMRLVVTQP